MANEPQVQLPPVVFIAGGENEELRESNLANAQAIPGYGDATLMVADAISKRADNVLLDYTAQGVAMKYQIDGIWHDLPPRDRQSGDAMLASLKCLANLDPNERRARQNGTFKVQFFKVKGPCNLTTQGVKTGERVMLEMAGDRPKLDKLDDLGMREKMIERYKELVEEEGGIVIITAMPKGGLTTVWTAALNSTDRFIRDYAGVQSTDFKDPEILNVQPNTYDEAAGKTAAALLKKLSLREPDAFVVPEIKDPDAAAILCEQASDHGRTVITRIHAKSADEALLRLLMVKPPVEKFAQAVRMVVNMRPVRRLCDNCKQAYQPAPQMLQKLGIPPGRIQAFYRPYQPPPQPPVDEKGNPIPQPICEQCQGLGYRGQTGIFELLVVDDRMRQVLLKKPKLDILRQVVKESGHHTLQDQGIVMVCQGITSLAEIQRVLKQ